jgi:hypothetical protein
VALATYANQLAGIDRDAARAAYHRAANAQRSYAAFATSGGEGTARMTEAERLIAKAASTDCARFRGQDPGLPARPLNDGQTKDRCYS